MLVAMFIVPVSAPCFMFLVTYLILLPSNHVCVTFDVAFNVALNDYC